MLEFEYADKFITREFTINEIKGKTDINFMFMPGSKFDFKSFKFVK